MRSILTKRAFFFSFIFLSHFALQAQWQEGYVITTEGDSLHGFLEVQNQEVFVCVFKDQLENSPKHFAPDQVRYFQYLNGQRFISGLQNKSLEVLGSKFYEVLITGVASLYYTKDGYYYLQKQDIAVVINGDEEKNSHLPGNTFRTLDMLLMDCPDAAKRVTDMDFNHEFLIKILGIYNEKCFGRKSDYYTNKIYKTNKSLSLIAASTFGNIKLNNGLQMGQTLSFGAGIAYKGLIKTYSNKLGYGLEVMYFKQKFHGLEIANHEVSTMYREAAIDLSTLYTSAMGTYKLMEDKVDITLHAGIGAYLPLKASYNMSEEMLSNSIVQTQTFENTVNLSVEGFVGVSVVPELFNKKAIGFEMRVLNSLVQEHWKYRNMVRLGVYYSIFLN